jgi:rhodanese-related sulfurtransferase
MNPSISAIEFRSLIASGCRIELIDVRTPVEFREIHVAIARNEPLDRLDPKAIQLARNGSDGEPLYVICRSGTRGKLACEKLIAAGMTQVINVEGGTEACAITGVPVVRGKKAVSLERQVRIAAGAMVFVGSLLGYFVHQYWFGLPAFVGAGLVFAGITDTCGMGMILAKMPWNQISPISPSGAGALQAQSCEKPSSGCCN